MYFICIWFVFYLYFIYMFICICIPICNPYLYCHSYWIVLPFVFPYTFHLHCYLYLICNLFVFLIWLNVSKKFVKTFGRRSYDTRFVFVFFLCLARYPNGTSTSATDVSRTSLRTSFRISSERIYEHFPIVYPNIHNQLKKTYKNIQKTILIYFV